MAARAFGVPWRTSLRLPLRLVEEGGGRGVLNHYSRRVQCYGSGCSQRSLC